MKNKKKMKNKKWKKTLFQILHKNVKKSMEKNHFFTIFSKNAK